MMYPRLKIAWDLLADDGLIAVSIDDKEVFQLGKLLDEIFGTSNKLACAPWLSEASGGKEKTGLRTGHEYLLIYYKRTSENVSQEERSTGELNLKDKYGQYRKGRELMKWGGTSLREDRPNQFYHLKTPDNIEVLPYRNDGKEGHWRWGKNNESIIKALEDPDFFHWELSSYDNGVEVNGQYERWVPYEKIRDQKKSTGWSSWLDKYGTNADGTREIKDLFGKKIFDTPKPTQLIKWLINLHADENAIVLDFFSGSCSTAHATMQLNMEDDGGRQFIMVQLNEFCDENSEAFKAGYKNICEIGRKRIDLAGDKILKENKDKDGIEKLDIGFKMFRVGDTSINWLHQDLKGGDLFDHYDKNASDKDKLDFTPDFNDLDVVYEIMLRQTDIPLSSRVVKLSDIGGRTYIFADSFVVCLEQNITRELVNRLAAIEPLPVKFVFRDSAFDDDIALKDETFRALSALIERNSGEKKQTYTVEFI